MQTKALHYELPEHLIATQPVVPRSSSRLMVINRQQDQVEHLSVAALPAYLAKDRLQRQQAGPDLLVFNQTSVLPAYLTLHREATGGKVTGLFLYEDMENKTAWHVLLEAKGKLQAGEILVSENQLRFELLRRIEAGHWLMNLISDPQGESVSSRTTPQLLKSFGQTPIPPYIRKKRKQQGQVEISPEDEISYNTIYAQAPPASEACCPPASEAYTPPASEAYRPPALEAHYPLAQKPSEPQTFSEHSGRFGGVAAPTAGLHFTSELLEEIESSGAEIAYVTLHVGHGTFAPIRTDEVEAHPIHQEWIEVSKETQMRIKAVKSQGGRVILIGTTTVRTIESLPDLMHTADDQIESVAQSTSLFITPDKVASGEFTFRYTDGLLTNFHLPESTLLALVAALPQVGLIKLRQYYQLAIEEQYRFYSYGDAMLIL